jgi:hypothetical protein
LADSWSAHAAKSNKKEQSRVAKKYKGVGTIGAIEPYTPPVVRDEVLASPAKSGMPTMSISPNPKAGTGWRASLKNAPADPKDVKRPTASDVVKT